MANTHSLDLELSSSQYAYRADTASLSLTGSFTIESWIRAESLPTDGENATIVSKINTTGNKRSYYFAITNRSGVYNLNASISTDGTYQSANDKSVNWTPSTGVFYHIAVVFDSTTPNFTFYVNGSPQGSSASITGTSIHNNDSRFHLGANNTETTPANYYDGLLDEVRIWNVARTASQIATYKNIEIITPKTGLVACWNLNNAYTDISGNTNTLTASGSPSFSTTTQSLLSGINGSLFFAQI